MMASRVVEAVLQGSIPSVRTESTPCLWLHRDLLKKHGAFIGQILLVSFGGSTTLVPALIQCCEADPEALLFGDDDNEEEGPVATVGDDTTCRCWLSSWFVRLHESFEEEETKLKEKTKRRTIRLHFPATWLRDVPPAHSVTLAPLLEDRSPSRSSAKRLLPFLGNSKAAPSFLSALLSGVVCTSGALVPILWSSSPSSASSSSVQQCLRVASCSPSSASSSHSSTSSLCRISETTAIHFSSSCSSCSSSSSPTSVKTGNQSWEDGVSTEVGGMQQPLSQLCSAIRTSFRLSSQRRSSFSPSSCIAAPRCALLHGISGTGKTLLAKAVARHSGFHEIFLSGPSAFKPNEGESEQFLSELFERAKANAPSILIIDEIDALAPARTKSSEDSSFYQVEQRIVSLMLSLLDSISVSPAFVFVIATTSRLSSIEQNVLAAGRFGDRLIECTAPTPLERLSIFKAMANNQPSCSTTEEHKGERVDWEELAKSTHGFVGADIDRLFKEAAMTALRRHQRQQHQAIETPTKAVITHEDFKQALKFVTPAMLAEHTNERKISADITFDTLGGLSEAIKQLQLSLIQPFEEPERFLRFGIAPPSGVLLHGPSGCGKTALAQAIANASQVNFVSVQGSEVLSKVLGESERALSRVFAKARASAPCILFIDQVEMVARKRGHDTSTENTFDRILSCLLTEMDGITNKQSMTSTAASSNNRVILLAGTLSILSVLSLRSSLFCTEAQDKR
ncbi:ATPases of the AAA class [Balamuthia mandrillaris]